MAKKAELKAKLSLSKVLWDKTLKSALVDAKAFGMAAGRAVATGAAAGFAAIAVAAIGAGVGIAILTKKAYTLGAELRNASEKTGIAVDQLMILQQAAKEKGIEDISTSIKFMQKNLVEATKKGSGPAAEALDVLGLRAEDLIKKLPADALKTIGDRIEAIENPALKAAEAVALFGRSGSELLPLFADKGALGDVGASIGGQARLLATNAEAFRRVADRLGRIELKFQGFGVGVASAILPAMDRITAKFDQLDLAAAGQKFGAAIEPVLEKLAKVDFAAGAKSFVDEMAKAEGIAEKTYHVFEQIHNLSMMGLGGIAKSIVSPSVERNTDALGETKPDEPVRKSYNVRIPTGFFAGRDPRNGGIFNKDISGPLQPGEQRGTYSDQRGARFSSDATLQRRRYDEYFKRFGQAGIDKMNSDRAGARPVPSSSALSSGGLRSGGLTGGGLSGGAYNQTGLLSHAERIRQMDSLIAAGALSPDARKTNANAYGVVRRGDRARAKGFQQEELRKQGTLTETNKLLADIKGELSSGASPIKPQGGTN